LCVAAADYITEWQEEAAKTKKVLTIDAALLASSSGERGGGRTVANAHDRQQ
jgi:hypothetical protein